MYGLDESCRLRGQRCLILYDKYDNELFANCYSRAKIIVTCYSTLRMGKRS